MKNTLLLVALLCCLPLFAQQKFVPDATGRVLDTDFLTLIKGRGYSLVGTYDTITEKPLLLYAKVLKDSLWGFIDIKGNEVIKPQFAFVEDFKDGFARAGSYVYYAGTHIVDTNTYWLINTRGKSVSREYRYIQASYNGFRITQDSLGFGILTREGKEILPPVYNGGIKVDEKYLFVWSDKKAAVFSHKGKQLTDFIFDDLDRYGRFLVEHSYTGIRLIDPSKLVPLNGIWYSREDYVSMNTDLPWPDDKKVFALKQGDKCYLVDYKGRHISEAFKGLHQRSAHYYVGIDNAGSWLVNDAGKKVLKVANYTSAGVTPDEELFWDYTGNDTVQFYDRRFCKMAFPEYDDFVSIGGNMLAVMKGHKWGLADYKGRQVLPLQYGYLYALSKYMPEGQFLTNINSKWGVIDTQGRVIIPLLYDSVDPVGSLYPEGINESGFYVTANWAYLVSKDGLSGIFDTGGRQRLDIAYEYIEPMIRPGYYKVQQQGKWGIVNNTFEVTAQPQFNEIVAEYPDENLMLVSFDDGMSLFDYKGWEVMPFNYNLGGIAFLSKEPGMGLNFKGMFVVDTNEGLQWVDLYGNTHMFESLIGIN